MSNKDVKHLLEQLHDALQDTELDADTKRGLAELDGDIHQLLDASQDDPDEGYLTERARSLDSEFSAEHPTASRVLREIIDTLGKMGL